MDQIPSMYRAALLKMDKPFIPQRWHVEYCDLDSEPVMASFATRKVAEEVASEFHGLFFLCDCPDRKCLFE